MKIGKAAPVLLKKAVMMCKSKTGVLADRLLLLASLRRRMTMAGVISHKIHALMVAADRAKAGRDCHKALVPCKVQKTPASHGGEIVDLTHQLALLCQDEDGEGGCLDWTLHPIFNDDNTSCCYIEEEDDDVGDVLLDACDGHHEETSVMDVIRSNREVQGLEFNMEDEIDQAADMFIRRFHERMTKNNF